MKVALAVAIVALVLLVEQYQLVRDAAARYAAVIAACANGQGITIGERVVRCQVVTP